MGYNHILGSKNALKKSMKFTSFNIYLLLKGHKTCKFGLFLKSKFLNPKFGLTSISYTSPTFKTLIFHCKHNYLVFLFYIPSTNTVFPFQYVCISGQAVMINQI